MELFKYFKEKCHADAFCKGSIRFALQTYYRNIEDIDKSDELEGVAVSNYNGIEKTINNYAQSNAMILCVSTDINKFLKYKHGNFVVRINCCETFNEALSASCYYRENGIGKNISNNLVTYDKGTFNREADFNDTVFQKPKQHCNEREYRFLFYDRKYAEVSISCKLDPFAFLELDRNLSKTLFEKLY